MTRRKTTPRVQATSFTAVKLTWPKDPLPTLAELEAALVRLVVERSDTQAEAAALLGISVKQLRSRVRRLAAPPRGA